MLLRDKLSLLGSGRIQIDRDLPQSKAVLKTVDPSWKATAAVSLWWHICKPLHNYQPYKIPSSRLDAETEAPLVRFRPVEVT